MRIGIFGGSFNPPHKMHLEIIKQLLEKKIVDKVIVIPTGSEYSKAGLVPSQDRFAMVQKMVQDLAFVEASDYEVRNGKKYTYETLSHFQRKYPNDTLFFLVGADNLEDLKNWREVPFLLSNFSFLVINRDQRNLEEITKRYHPYEEHIIFTDVKTTSLSSTWIRTQLREGKNEEVKDYLPERVLSYIQEHNLYVKN